MPLRTEPSSVTVGDDRAVLSGIMQIVTSAVRVFVHVMALDVLGLSLRELLDERRWADAGTAHPPWTFQTATLCILLGVGALCGIAVVSPRKAGLTEAQERRRSPSPFFLCFGWYGFNPGSMLQCLGGHEPVLSAIVRQLHGKAETRNTLLDWLTLTEWNGAQ